MRNKMRRIISITMLTFTLVLGNTIAFADDGTNTDNAICEEAAEVSANSTPEGPESETVNNVSDGTNMEELTKETAQKTDPDADLPNETNETGIPDNGNGSEEVIENESSVNENTDAGTKVTDPAPTEEPTEEYVLSRVEIADNEQVYTDAGLPPLPTEIYVYGKVTRDGVTEEVLLEKNKDYRLGYRNCFNAGTATVVVMGWDNYEDQEITADYTVLPATITSAKLKYSYETYTGKARTQTSTTAVYCGDKVLKNGTDYKITYENNISPGTATMTITGIGNYTGTLTETYQIRVKLASATLKYSSLKYKGYARTQTSTTVVTAMVNGKPVTLKKGTDYKVSYKNNTNVGTATMTIKGTGDYFGTITKKFNISPAKIGSASLSSATKLYTGKAISPAATVYATVDGETVKLKKGTDYTVTYADNKNVGTATVTIKGMGNFSGTITKTFSITHSRITGNGATRIMYVAPVSAYSGLSVAVWSDMDGQDDIEWYTMKQCPSGNWKAVINLSGFKDYGTVHAHVYSGSQFICSQDFTVSDADWLYARSLAFQNDYMYYSGAYENIDYVQCAVNIANDDYYGYGHTWRDDQHTISCAGLVGLSLTYCGYANFIKDDPVEQLDGRRWGYIDLGTYSGKYDWTNVMINEAGATWHSGLDEIEAGDILYYDYGITGNHAGIYLGGGLTVEARGPYGGSGYDDSGSEVAIYSGLWELPWQGYFRINNKNYI